MNRERLLRRSLWAAAVANLGGAVLFGFPDSALGQLAGLPAAVPPLYRAMTAAFVLLFGGAYAWLAAQPRINRPFVAFGAIGKTAAFLTVTALSLAGAAAARSVAVLSADLVLAALFVWGLAGTRGDGGRG